jgi:hypothetical protein
MSGLRLVCRHERNTGPESWAYYVDGRDTLPAPIHEHTTAVTLGEAPLAVLTAPDGYGNNPDAPEQPDVPLDGVLAWRLDVFSPLMGSDGEIEARRWLHHDVTAAVEYVLDQARLRVVLIVNVVARDRAASLEEAGEG